MNSYRPYGDLKSPLTSSSDSLCGTEKQLVTSTECLSTVPVRENGPSVIKPWASNCPKCFPRGDLEVKEQQQKSKLYSEAPKFQPYAPMEPGFSREMKPQSYVQLSSSKISKQRLFFLHRVSFCLTSCYLSYARSSL